ncbi:MAG: hypothetical protein NTY19_30855 [Planctomycetota bacterium]|nr:hypothetical protein [Planctomycetota bacterium]
MKNFRVLGVPFCALFLASVTQVAQRSAVAEESRPRQLVESQTLEQARTWLEYVTCRVQNRVGTWPDQDSLRVLAEQLPTAELLRQLRASAPDPTRVNELQQALHRALETFNEDAALRHAAQPLDAALEALAPAIEAAILRHPIAKDLAQLRADGKQQPKEAWASCEAICQRWLRLLRTVQAGDFCDLLNETGDAAALLRQLQSAGREGASIRQQLQEMKCAIEAFLLHVGLLRELRAVDAALSSYAALLETSVRPDAVRQELGERLQLLESQLTKCAENKKPTAENLTALENLAALDQTVTWLRLHHQAADRLEQILHPRLRVYVSRDLLNEPAAALADSLSFPLKRKVNGIQLSGCVSTAGRLRVETIRHDGYGVLALRFCDPVQFCGTVQRGRINLGVSFGLDVNASKRFYLMQDTPDATPATSQVELRWTDTDRGRLVDGVVDLLARRGFDGSGVNEEIARQIDDAGRALGDLVSLGETPLLRSVAKRHGLLLKRHYRTFDDGGECVFRVADGQVAKPSALPRVDQAADFRVSIHGSVLNALTVPDLLGAQERHTLHSLRDLVARTFEVEGQIFEEPALGDVQIDQPTKAPFVHYQDGQLEINFLARRENQPKTEEFVCNIHVQPSLTSTATLSSPAPATGILLDERSLRIRVLAGGRNAEDRQAFERQLRAGVSPTLRLVRVRLPGLSHLSEAAVSRLEQHCRLHLLPVQADAEYLTIAAQLQRAE